MAGFSFSESLDNKKNHSVLITGATGFIGRHLVPFLSAENWQVHAGIRNRHALKRLVSGAKPVIIGELRDSIDFSESLKGIYSIVHLAARVHIMNDNSHDKKEAYQKINVEATKNLAEAAIKAGVKRFVFLSSVKAMGDSTPSSVPFNESSACHPKDSYGHSKLDAELNLLDIGKKTGFEIVILRLPLVYGPSVKGNFLRLMKLIKFGIPLPLSSIKNRRSFLYVGNLLSAILMCLTHPAAAGETFLVSDNEDLSTDELIRCIANNMGCPSRLFPLPEKLLHCIGRITHTSEHIDRLLSSLVIESFKIRNQLGWKPPFSMQDGLIQTTRWFNQAEEVLN